jgi:hypothetical protein
LIDNGWFMYWGGLWTTANKYRVEKKEYKYREN